MQEATWWLGEFWQGLSLVDLIGFSVLGTVLGFVAGVAWYVWMQRRRWLQRSRGWHQLLLATYAVLLPLGCALIGAQLGFAAGTQRVVNRQLDHFQPHMQQLVDDWRRDFDASLEAGAAQAAWSGDATLVGVVQLAVDDYLAAHPLEIAALDEDRWYGRLALGGLDWVRGTLMQNWAEDAVAGDLAGRVGIGEDVVREALHMRLDELIHTRGLVWLLKAQIASMMAGIYLGILLPLGIAALLLFAEIALAYRLGWRSAPPPEPSTGLAPATGDA